MREQNHENQRLTKSEGKKRRRWKKGTTHTQNEIFILCKLNFISKHFIMLKHKLKLFYKMKQINYIDVCALRHLIADVYRMSKESVRNKRYEKLNDYNKVHLVIVSCNESWRWGFCFLLMKKYLIKRWVRNLYA